MDEEDLILEGVKNSLEAGASIIEVSIDGNSFSIVDDGEMSRIPDFRACSSSKGGKRGRGLFLISEASRGRCSITRESGRTVLRATFDRALEAERIIPICFNLTQTLVFHSLRDGRERYLLDSEVLRKMDVDPMKAIDLARLKRIIREKEQRS